MKILYFITTSNWGGASHHVYDLCKYQKGIGNQVYLAVGSKGLLSEKVQKLDIPIFILNSVKRNISPINDFKSVISFRRLVKKINPDIVHLHSSKAGIVGRLASAGLKNNKVIFTVHGWSFTDGVPSRLKKFIYKSVEKLVSPLTDLFICVSDFDKSIGFRNHVLGKQSKVIVIHNGSLVPDKSKINFSIHNQLRLIMIARFSSQKDQDTLINAVKDLPLNSYKLIFVGDGERLQYCKNLVSKFNLETNISFVGFSTNISKFLEKNDIFIMTSHYEGLPISIIEAMSYGLPVIGSDVGGNSELIVNNINGYLIKEGDHRQLSKVLNTLINDRNLIVKMGHESYNHFLNKFKLSEKLEEVNKIYEELIKSEK